MRQYDQLDTDLHDLAVQNRALKATLAALRAEHDALKQQLEVAEATVAALRADLAAGRSHSSTPRKVQPPQLIELVALRQAAQALVDVLVPGRYIPTRIGAVGYMLPFDFLSELAALKARLEAPK